MKEVHAQINTLKKRIFLSISPFVFLRKTAPNIIATKPLDIVANQVFIIFGPIINVLIA